MKSTYGSKGHEIANTDWDCSHSGWLLISIWGTLLLDNSSQQIRVTLRNIGNGLYASENISMTGTDGLLYISNSSSTVHLIQSNYLSEINQNNIANYSIKPVKTSTVTSRRV